MLFPPGSYWARLVGAAMQEIGDNQTPCLAMTFDVTHVADAAAEGGWRPLSNPEQRIVKLWLTEKAYAGSEERLRKFGFNGDFGRPDFSAEFKEGTELSCKHKPYNGKTYDEFEFPMSGGGGQPADADVVRRMNAQWKTNNQAAAKPAGAPPAAPAAPVRRTVHAPKGAPAAAPQQQAAAGVPTGDEPPF